MSANYFSTTHHLKLWLILFFVFGNIMPGQWGMGRLFANTIGVQGIIFDQNGTGPLTSSGIISLGSPTATVSDFQTSGGLPEASNGTVAAWVENGTDIYVIIFYQDGAGPLTSSGIISLGSASSAAGNFQLTGLYPGSNIGGAAVAWVENGTDIYAITFSYSGMILTSSGIISLGSASAPVTSFQLTGNYPKNSSTGAAVAWVQSGTDIYAITFDQNGSGPLTSSGIISLGSASGTVTNFQLTGIYPESSSNGAAVAWVQSGTDIYAITFDQNGSGPLTSSGIISLGSATAAATNFQLTGAYPENTNTGAAVAWVENGTTIHAITFDKNGSASLTNSGIIPLGSASSTVTNFQLTGDYPETSSHGAALAWVESGTVIHAITFDKDGSLALTSSGIISLGSASSAVTNFQLSGLIPEFSSSGVVVAWVENGKDIYAITFDKNGSGALTSSGIISLGSAAASVANFLLTGGAPETSTNGAAAVWVFNVSPVSSSSNRAYLRPSNRR